MVCTTIEYIENWLRANLTKERFEHSLGTAECARWLAEKFGVDSEKAYFAGLIHDCAKCLPKEETLSIINGCVDLDEGELENPKTHHAPAGVYVAEKEFGVEDKEVLDSIRCHTVGKEDMTTFEKIIFLADKIEERTRPKELIEPIKAVLDEDCGLDKALFLCYKNTINSLTDRNLKICTKTIDIYNRLCNDLDLNGKR